MKPRVSVLIPCYNAGRYLAAALDSVLAQTYRDFEIIVVDDGSTDDSAAVAARYPQVRYFHHIHSGISVTRNLCLSKAEGEFMLFLLKYDETLVAQAKAEAEKRGVTLRTITAAFMPQMGVSAWNTTGVTDWLSAIRNAQCVFTNSFHGMVFSMIFGRSFHVQRLTGELSSRNGRLEELLSFLELSHALDGVAEPDYDNVWKLLEPRRTASLDYLRRIISHDAAI